MALCRTSGRTVWSPPTEVRIVERGIHLFPPANIYWTPTVEQTLAWVLAKVLGNYEMFRPFHSLSGPWQVLGHPDSPLSTPARRGWGTKTTLSDPQEYIRVPCPGELAHQPCLSLPLHTGALRWGQSLPGSRDGILVPSPQRPEAAAMEHEQWGAMLWFQTSL